MEFKKGDRIKIIDNQYTRKNGIASKTGTIIGIMLYHVLKIQLDGGDTIMMESSEIIKETIYHANPHNN